MQSGHKMKKKIFTIIFLILILNAKVYAQDVQKGSIETVELTIEQAYDLLLTNNKSLKVAEEVINEKKYKKRAAIGHFFPKVVVNTTYIGFSQPIGTEVSGRELVFQDQNVWGVGGVALWNIFTGGKILAMNSAARANYIGANEKLREVRDSLTSSLIERYYGLKFARDVITVRKQVLETAQKHLDDAKKLEAAGIIPKSERLHAEVAFSKADREYKAATRDAVVVEDALKSLIKADSVDLKDVVVNPTSKLFIYNKEFEKLDEYKKIASDNSPLLKQMDVKKKLAQANYRSEVSNYSPVVSLFAYDIVGSKDLGEGVPRYAMGATANFLLFDGLTRYNNVKAAASVKKQVALESEEAENKITTLVSKQYNDLLKYKEQYESTESAIQNAEEALRVSTKSFNEGFGTSLAVTDSQTALAGVKIERLNAIYNYDKCLAELLKSDGKTNEIFNYINDSTKESL